MKRKISVGLCTGLVVLSLVGCSSTNKEEEVSKTDVPVSEQSLEMKDGVYEAETKEADEQGGKAIATIKVEGGKVVEATYNEFNDNGNKRDNKEYNEMMKEKAGTNPSEFEPQIEKQIEDAQSAEIDGVSGATGSSSKAKQLFKAAFNNANKGKAEKELVEIK